ncbi:MAG: hypothetical protein Q9220_002338 [cf. Caloplaca sp. 1 TL-2023]
MAEPSACQKSAAAKPLLRRPLFTKPSWAQKEDAGNATDFFRRSNQNYVNIAVEAERERQRKLARRARHQQHLNQIAEPRAKRQRTSSESGSDTDSTHSTNDEQSHITIASKQDVLPVIPNSLEGDRITTYPQQLGSPKSLSERYENALAVKEVDSKQTSLPSNVIDLEDEGEDDEEDILSKAQEESPVEVSAVARPAPTQEDDDLFPSDDEFAELARKARTSAEAKKLQAYRPTEPPDPRSPILRNENVDSHSGISDARPYPNVPDPTVSILITSRIPNTNPLIVNRKVSQRLKEVRLVWCQRQGFATEFTTTVFLQWRGKRLFDVTSCRSLGVGVDPNGKIVLRGQKDILGEEEGQLHMEAITEELLKEDQRMGQQESHEGGQRETEMEAEQPPGIAKLEAQVRIVLKAPGHGDLKLIVKPTTRMSRIVGAFRSDKKIEESREVFLSFDGDRLSAESQVQDTELSDMDYIDVYVK